MKKIIKYSNYFGFVLALCASVIFGCRCSTSKSATDPLAGWQTDFHEQPSPAIEKDYHDFIQNLQPKGERPAQATGFLEDGTGQHAINIEIFEYHQNASWQYVLIYDKGNKRVKVIKYGYRKYQS